MTTSPTRPGAPLATTTIDLDGSWAIGDKIHGGYLLAQIVRTAMDGGQFPHPLGVSAHFVSAPDPGAADVEVEQLRVGRRVGFLRSRLRQGEQIRAEVLITTGTIPDADPVYASRDAAAPVLPPPDECIPSAAETPTGGRIGSNHHMDLRIDPATAGWIRHEPSGQGVVRAWIRRRDLGELDPFWLLIAGDAPPPNTFDLGIRGWVPTVTLDAQLRALPRPGWLIAEQSAQVVAGGWLDETCTLWDETGRLVASIRQLAGYRES